MANPISNHVARLRYLLGVVYNSSGPRVTSGEVMPIRDFAAMSRSEVGAKYDFEDRHLMHEIARELAKPVPQPIPIRRRRSKP